MDSVKNIFKNTFREGQAALTAIIFFVFISLVILGGFGSLALSRFQIARELLAAKRAFATADSLVEDVVYRQANSSIFRVPDQSLSADWMTSLNSQAVGKFTIQSNLDGSSQTQDFLVTATGDSGGHFRTLKLSWQIPDNKLIVKLKGAMEVGAMGMHFDGNTSLTAYCGGGPCSSGGNFYSNGNIDEGGNPDIIDGSLILARGTSGVDGVVDSITSGGGLNPATDDQPTLSYTNAASLSTMLDPKDGIVDAATTSRNVFAQSFIAPFTGYPTRFNVRVTKRSVADFSNGSLDFELRASQRLNSAGSSLGCAPNALPETAVCHDVPKEGVGTVLFASGSILANTLDWNNYKWVTVTLNISGSQAPLVANDKYWLVFLDKTSDGTGSSPPHKYYQIDMLQAGSDYSVLNDPTLYYDKNIFGDSNFRVDDTAGIGVYFPSNSTNNIPVSTATTSAQFGRDMAFQLFMGPELSQVSGFGSSGRLTITKDVIAQEIVGADIWGHAYFHDVNEPQLNPDGTLATQYNTSSKQKNLTTAGGRYLNDGVTDNNPVTPKTYDGGSAAYDNLTRSCRANDVGSLSPAYTPYTTHSNFCACNNIDASTGSTFCHSDASIITNKIPLFTYKDGPVTGYLIQQYTKLFNSVPVPQFGNVVFTPRNDANFTDPIDPTKFEFFHYLNNNAAGSTQSLAGLDGRTAQYAWNAAGTVLTFSTTSLQNATSTIQLPAVIDGSVAITGSTHLELSAGPPNKTVDLGTNLYRTPYVLLIKGDLSVTGANTCRIYIHQPRDGAGDTFGDGGFEPNGPSGTALPSIPVFVQKPDIPLPIGVLVIVTGTITTSGTCPIVPNSNPSSYIHFISLSKNSTNPSGSSGLHAMTLGMNAPGSSFFAFRGSIRFSGATNLLMQAVSAAFISSNSRFSYIEDLVNPASEFGGSVPSGAQIMKFYESE